MYGSDSELELQQLQHVLILHKFKY